MKTFSIEWLERKETKTGKPVLNVSLKDDEGKEYEKVSIWGDFPRFADLAAGHKVSGNLFTNDKGYITLYPPKPTETNPNSPARGGGMKANMSAVMDKKQANIEKSQENKGHGIKVASTLRDAVLIVTARGLDNSMTDDDIKAGINFWREWLWNVYDVEDKDMPPFSN